MKYLVILAVAVTVFLSVLHSCEVAAERMQAYHEVQK